MTWTAFGNGSSIGLIGSEGGTILRDEEHSVGARITLEQCKYSPFAITCGLYGNMVHTIFVGTENEGQTKFDGVRSELDYLISIWPNQDAPQEAIDRFHEAINGFVERYP
ncbi:hypothetical protein GCM10007874_43060 [Labrys miyagiensis]|uniref:Uncharacterized protein n=1 Tax=Labrys miyagiensis TaxID=346912 RepID=A0ABQ6CNJ0_9HYPH|nr:hypothetical protein GCM10007874_43060 [Labrys miyagiensis]